MIVLLCLLWAGVPPVQALAINKCQSVFGTLSSTPNFLRKRSPAVARRCAGRCSTPSLSGHRHAVGAAVDAAFETGAAYVLIVWRATALSPRDCR